MVVVRGAGGQINFAPNMHLEKVLKMNDMLINSEFI